LIHLDDLIPKQDVKGSHQLLFGVTDPTQKNKQPDKRDLKWKTRKRKPKNGSKSMTLNHPRMPKEVSARISALVDAVLTEGLPCRPFNVPVEAVRKAKKAAAEVRSRGAVSFIMPSTTSRQTTQRIKTAAVSHFIAAESAQN
jgi:hypothetical protein